MIPVFPSQTNDPRLLDFEKYLAGNELQVGGFDLLYKALNKKNHETSMGLCLLPRG